jgi:hypothetical protein
MEAASSAEGVIDAHRHVRNLSVRDQNRITGRQLAPV